MTHGFDDSGRQFDEKGNLADWWTPESAKRFKERAAGIVKQFGAYVGAGGVHVNGELTQGENIADLAPFLGDRMEELADWKNVSLLTVTIDRLSQWSRPGLLCIGDAGHAMSPIGGVGINLAIQDAVAAANLLGAILLQRVPTESELHAVQRRRTFPTWAMQRLQIAIQNNVIRKVLGSSKALALPWPLKLMRRWPILRRLPARVVGVGFRPEHVKTPDTRTAV